MSHSLHPGRLLGGLVALVSAAIIALAAGAVWMLVALYSGAELRWLAIPAGLVLGWAMRVGVTRSRPRAALLGILATVLAAFYMLGLRGAMQIAALMGMPFAEALREAGAPMLLDIARIGLPSMAGPLALGALAAALGAFGRRR
jgi:hypothetical protein